MVDPKTVLAEYLTAISEVNLRPEGVREETFELIDHVDTFLAFEKNINHKTTSGH